MPLGLNRHELDIAVVAAGHEEPILLRPNLAGVRVVRREARQAGAPHEGLPVEEVSEGAREGMRHRAHQVVDLARGPAPVDAAVLGTPPAEARRLRLVLRNLGRGRVYVWKTRVPNLGAHDNFPGQIRQEQGHLYVACADDTYVEILSLQRDGEPEVSAQDFKINLRDTR